MSSYSDKTFLGTGWGFPPTFRKEKKGVVMVSAENDINSSLEILLTTRLNERTLQPKFGCDLHHLLFEPMNLTTVTYIKGLVKDAIVRFEPRIKLINLLLENDFHEGKVEIKVEYEIRGTNSRFNYVYPFYKEEGTNLGA